MPLSRSGTLYLRLRNARNRAAMAPVTAGPSQACRYSSPVSQRGVALGDGAIVAAGAVVKKTVPYDIWAGMPATKPRGRFVSLPQRGKHEAVLAGPLVPPAFLERRANNEHAIGDEPT